MSIWGGVKNNAGKILGFNAGGGTGALLGHKAVDEPGAMRRAQEGFDPYGGQPNYPTYQDSYDPGKMSVAGDYSAAANAGRVNTAGMDRYRQEAMQVGQSPWAQLTSKKIGNEARAARQLGAKDIAGQQAGVASQLAMRGGLQSGARERMARGGARAALDMNQDIAKQEMAGRLQTGINAEQNRLSQLGALPGMEISQANALRQNALTGVQGREKDIDRQLTEQEKRNAYNMARYQADTSAWAAMKQADATSRTAPKGMFGGSGFLGLGLI